MRLSPVVLALYLALAACGQQAPPKTNATDSAPVVHDPSRMSAGECVDTTVSNVGSRLEDMPTSGSAILYANGLSQVSYDAVPGIDHSHAGDAVHLCLASVPQHCPPGDNRGKVYAATNTRTGESWSAPDSEHMCGGA